MQEVAHEKVYKEVFASGQGYCHRFRSHCFQGVHPSFDVGQWCYAICGSKCILNKNYKDLMIKESASVNNAAEEYGKKHCGREAIPLPTWRIRKE